MRTIVSLPPDLLDSLARWCRRDRISRAEAIRRAVAGCPEVRRAAEPTPAFGLWRKRRVDGLHYEARLRHEWDRPGRSR